MSLEPISRDEAIKWVKNYLGDSFVIGRTMNLEKGYVVVTVKTENGEEEHRLSIPRKIVSQ